MLILTRRVGETVHIGEEIQFTVLGVRGTQVRIGINAPRDVPVHREEIYNRIRREENGDGPADSFADSGYPEPGNEAPPPEAEAGADDSAGDPYNV